MNVCECVCVDMCTVTGERVVHGVFHCDLSTYSAYRIRIVINRKEFCTTSKPKSPLVGSRRLGLGLPCPVPSALSQSEIQRAKNGETFAGNDPPSRPIYLIVSHLGLVESQVRNPRLNEAELQFFKTIMMHLAQPTENPGEYIGHFLESVVDSFVELFKPHILAL